MLVCKVCSENFTPVRNMLARYCSPKCKKSANIASLSEKSCEGCKETYKPYDKRQKFCSQKCSAKTSNTNRGRKRECSFCEGALDKGQAKFCTRECGSSYRLFDKYEDWFNGFISASEVGTEKLLGAARNLLVEIYDYQCSRCQWGEINPRVGKPILTVNHIDGNWKNNYFWNLEVLCYNCHTLTPTFGSLNRGSISGRREY